MEPKEVNKLDLIPRLSKESFSLDDWNFGGVLKYHIFDLLQFETENSPLILILLQEAKELLYKPCNVWDHMYTLKIRLWQALLILVPKSYSPDIFKEINQLTWEIISFNDLSPIWQYTELFAIKVTLQAPQQIIENFILPRFNEKLKPQISASLLLILSYTYPSIDIS